MWSLEEEVEPERDDDERAHRQREGHDRPTEVPGGAIGYQLHAHRTSSHLLPYVEEYPEDKRNGSQVVPDDRERAERCLKPLDVERLTVGGRLLHERDRRDRARPHEQYL